MKDNDLPVSVLMPVYNTKVEFLKAAVESILTQTFQDYEFIIVDDGSSGETKEYLEHLTDPRIRLIRNPDNIGITKSLNRGLRQARGKYIARMDGDDISFPERFEKEYQYMESHPDVIICGSRMTYSLDKMVPTKKRKNDMDEYRIRTLFVYPGPNHPTIMIRRESLLKYKIEYDETLRYSQDYDLYRRIGELGKIVILPEVLHYFRRHEGQINRAHRQEQIQCDKEIQERLLCRLLDQVTQEELDMHYQYSTGYYHDLKLNREIWRWYRRLIHANDQRRIYPRWKFRKQVYYFIFRVIYRNMRA